MLPKLPLGTHTTHCLPCRTFQLSIGIKVIECLRQETRHVDGIGTGQLQMFVELAVHKSGFNQSLAIVERTIDLNSRDILP